MRVQVSVDIVTSYRDNGGGGGVGNSLEFGWKGDKGGSAITWAEFGTEVILLSFCVH